MLQVVRCWDPSRQHGSQAYWVWQRQRYAGAVLTSRSTRHPSKSTTDDTDPSKPAKSSEDAAQLERYLSVVSLPLPAAAFCLSSSSMTVKRFF
jgi:hypothetical protein